MTTKTQQTASKYLRAVAIAALLGISSGAHAVCVNADGSLDDSSMDSALIDRGMLPACEVQASAPAQVAAPQVAKPQEHTAKSATESVQLVKKAKRSDQSAHTQGDCRTANGESREGSLGAVDMLPACGT